MRRLILKLVLFLLGFSLLFAFPAWVFYQSGEWATIDGIVKRQQSAAPLLVGFAYRDAQVETKLRALKARKPAVVALGTSRVMQFRSDFFNRSFYNAGCGVRQFSNLRKIIEALASHEQPQLLILELDHKFFNPDWKNVPELPEMVRRTNPKTNWLWMLIYSWDNIYRDYFKHKFSISDLVKRSPDAQRVGVAAHVHNRGFRNDGSHQWKKWKDDSDDLKNLTLYKDIYLPNTGISDQAINELDAFLSHCKRRGIYVAGFLPPFSPEVYNALQKQREEFVYVFKSAERLRPVFQKHGFAFEDFTDPAPFDAEITGFVDGQHLSEEAYRLLWELWQNREPHLKQFSTMKE